MFLLKYEMGEKLNIIEKQGKGWFLEMKAELETLTEQADGCYVQALCGHQVIAITSAQEKLFKQELCNECEEELNGA